ncbi:MAG: class I SAM-dependent methyltransferase, partial [Gallicola sp.]|nr:class I SAM-dependent methyltransferase [Gallicola sp.]
MSRKITLFDRIAPIYGLFYDKQKRWFEERFDKIPDRFHLSSYKTVIDIGCGTGALSSVFHKKGYQVIGVDIAEKMLKIGREKEENQNIDFFYGDVLRGLEFPDQSFDMAFASYVAHGLKKED